MLKSAAAPRGSLLRRLQPRACLLVQTELGRPRRNAQSPSRPRNRKASPRSWSFAFESQRRLENMFFRQGIRTKSCKKKKEVPATICRTSANCLEIPKEGTLLLGSLSTEQRRYRPRCYADSSSDILTLNCTSGWQVRTVSFNAEELGGNDHAGDV